MSKVEQRLSRDDALFQFLTRLPGDDFGQDPACASDDVDPELFFPPSKHATEQIAAAKQVCDGCPVREACLESALHTRVEGVWGGTTYEERAQIRRDRMPHHKDVRGQATDGSCQGPCGSTTEHDSAA